MADDPEKRRASAGDSPYLAAVSEETRAKRRHFAPAAERNAGPILAILKDCLPGAGDVLEIGTGTGQHVAVFARAFRGLQWWPSDPDPVARDSIAAWSGEAGLTNIRPPLDLDVTKDDWYAPLERGYSAVLAINLIHISPWAATEGLIRGAGSLLSPGGVLYLYGPYKREGAHTAPSNASFDGWLKSQSSQWGVRDMEHVEREAGMHDLRPDGVVPMPANNFSLIFRKR